MNVAPAPPPGDPPGRSRLLSWLIATVVVFAAIVGAYRYQQGQQVCVGRYDAEPSPSALAWWGCPTETNRFNRGPTRLPTGLAGVTLTADGSHGWAVGPSGLILVTEDLGVSWQVRKSGVTANLAGIAFADDGRRGWAVGGDKTIVRTIDGGEQWMVAPLDDAADLQHVATTGDGGKVVVVGARGTVQTSADGGLSWVARTSTTSEATSTDLWGAAVSSDGAIRAVGDAGRLITTGDGGQTWQVQTWKIDSVLRDVSFGKSQRRGWIVGSRATVLFTPDGGSNWIAQRVETTSDLAAVAICPDGQHGWAVGDGGTILTTKNGGNTWAAQLSGVQSSLSGVAFASDCQRGVVVGDRGVVLSTTDGGTGWHPAGLYARGVAPWYFAFVALAMLAYASLFAWRAFTNEVRPVDDRIAFEGIADAPVSRADQDRLAFTPIADAVVAFLRHEKTLPSLTIAVTAPWGQGKSSLMGLMRSRLQVAGAPTVWFNAWHHQKEPVLLAALLSAVVSQGLPPWLTIFGMRFRAKLIWMRFRKRPFSGALPLLLFYGGALASILLAVAWAVTPATPPGDGAHALPHPVFARAADLLHGQVSGVTGNVAIEALLSGEWSKFARESIGAFGQEPSKVVPLFVAVVFIGSLFLLFTYFCRPFPANPSALLASVGTRFSLSQAEDQTSLRQRFRDHFQDVTKALQPRTLTVFIDDLDRCEPAKAAELLEAINYLTDAGLCFVVIGMAREIVEAQLGEAYGALADRAAEFDRARRAGSVGGAPPAATDTVADDAQVRLNYARDYLKKLIQISVPVPMFGSRQMDALLARDRGADEAPDAVRRRVAFERLCDAIERARARFWRLLRLAVPIVVAAWLVHQGSLWMHVQDDKAIAAKAEGNAALDRAESALSQARQYVSYLRREAAGATASPGIDAAARDARLREADRWLTLAEKATDRMVEAQRLKQPAARDEADDERAKMQARVMTLANADTAYGKALPSSKSTAGEQAATGGAIETAAAPARARQTDDAYAPDPGTSVAIALTVPLGLLVVVATAGVLLGRDRFEIREGQSYKNALRHWQPVLLDRAAMRAPREAKRFLNLSRYLVLRANAGQYLTWSWIRKRFALRRNVELPDGGKVIDEAAIVGLTALWMTGPRTVQGAMKAFLGNPVATLRDIGDDPTYVDAVEQALKARDAGLQPVPWTREDVDAFLRAVGELT